MRYFAIEAKDRQIFADPEGQILAGGGAIFFVEIGGRPVGCCALIRMDAQTFELAKMAVTAGHQGQGLSKLLMTACIERARSEGAERVYLETNTRLRPAISLYRSFGFVDVEMTAAPPSEYARVDAWMELRLR